MISVADFMGTSSTHSRIQGFANSRLDLDALRACRDDRLDELAVRVPVPAVHQFADAVLAVRPFVVDAGEIQRAEWIVRRSNQVNGGEPPLTRSDRIAQDGGFVRGQHLARAPSQIAAARAQLVRPAGWRRGRYDDG